MLSLFSSYLFCLFSLSLWFNCCISFSLSGFTSIAMFLFTREVWNTRAALFSACFIAIVPGKKKKQEKGNVCTCV